MADQRIILISWHATLSPFTGRFILSLSLYLSFFLFYRLYPLLRYSLSLYAASSSFLFFAGYSPRRNRESFLPSQLLGREVPVPSFPPPSSCRVSHVHIRTCIFAHLSMSLSPTSVLSRASSLSPSLATSSPRLPGFRRPSSCTHDCLPSSETLLVTDGRQKRVVGRDSNIKSMQTQTFTIGSLSKHGRDGPTRSNNIDCA